MLMAEYLEGAAKWVLKWGAGSYSASGSATKYYIIASTHRTGSTVLSTLLTQTLVSGYPNEYFIQDKPNRMLTRAKQCDGFSMEEYTKWLINNLKTPNGIFGINEQFRAYEQAEMPLDSYSPSYIHLSRVDKIRQGISFFRVFSGEAYASIASSSKILRTSDYSFSQIKKCIKFLTKQEDGWAEHFEKNNITPVRVIYEDFIKDMAGTVSRVLKEALDIDYPAEYVKAPVLQKQADDLSEYYYQRYMRDLEAEAAST